MYVEIIKENQREKLIKEQFPYKVPNNAIIKIFVITK